MLASNPLAQRGYGRLKQQGVGADFPEFTVARAGGPNAPIVFVRASGAPLTRECRASTPSTATQAFLKAIDQVALRTGVGGAVGARHSRPERPAAR